MHCENKVRLKWEMRLYFFQSMLDFAHSGTVKAFSQQSNFPQFLNLLSCVFRESKDKILVINKLTTWYISFV